MVEKPENRPNEGSKDLGTASKKIEPNRVPIKQGVKDIISQGSPLAEKTRMPMGPISGPKGDDGRTIITYTTDWGTPKEPQSFRVTNGDGSTFITTPTYKPLSHNYRAKQMLEHAFKEIEAVANVRFVAVDGSSEEKARSSNIRFLLASDLGGSAGNSRIEGRNQHEIIISEGIINQNIQNIRSPGSGYDTVLHETMHALGFRHPRAKDFLKGGGDDPAYSQVATVMSYNNADVLVLGLGPYDVAALEFLYGKPKDIEYDYMIDATEATQISTLVADKPVTVDFTGSNKSGTIKADLSSKTYGKQFTGMLLPGYAPNNWAQASINSTHPVQIRFAGDAIKDIYTDKQVKLIARGNALPNHLAGGGEQDFLTAFGGKDTLTGGGSNDVFIFNEKSGLGNEITDFLSYGKAKEDYEKAKKENPLEAVKKPSDIIWVSDEIKAVSVGYDAIKKAPKLEFINHDDVIVADVTLLPSLSIDDACTQARCVVYKSDPKKYPAKQIDNDMLAALKVALNEAPTPNNSINTSLPNISTNSQEKKR